MNKTTKVNQTSGRDPEPKTDTMRPASRNTELRSRRPRPNVDQMEEETEDEQRPI